MDIILATNSDDPYLAFRDVVRFHDGSGYSTRITVRSGWITAEDYMFYFEAEPFARFLAGLENIDRTLAGVALLKPLFEATFIEFRGTRRGHVEVRGDLIFSGDLDQRVQFAFETDQTCLAPLIDAFRRVARCD